jgi:hypothetical protein
MKKILLLLSALLLTGCASRPGFTYVGDVELREIYGTCGGFTNSYYLDYEKGPGLLVSIRRQGEFTAFSLAKLEGLNKSVVFPDKIDVKVNGISETIQKSDVSAKLETALYKVHGLPDEIEVIIGSVNIGGQVLEIKPINFKYQIRHYLQCVQ